MVSGASGAVGSRGPGKTCGRGSGSGHWLQLVPQGFASLSLLFHTLWQLANPNLLPSLLSSARILRS